MRSEYESNPDIKSKTYSHSKLWLFENCPEAYKIKYIDKAFPELPKSIELFLGDIVHQSLEWLYLEIRDGRKVGLDDLAIKFVELWNSQFSHEFRMVNGGDEKFYFNKALKYLIDYYKKNEPFEDNTIEIEKRVFFPIDNEGKYFIQGYIDRLVKKSDEEYEVHDYKTNESMKTQEQVDKDRQLAFYHLGLQDSFGKQIKVNLIWHFLAHNKTITSRRKEKELDELKSKTVEMIKIIEENKEWHPCGKRWCDWCDFKRKNFIEDKNISSNFGNSNLKKYF